MNFPYRLVSRLATAGLFLLLLGSASTAFAQPGGGPDTPDKKILKDFDTDADGILNKDERAKARKSLKSNAGGLFGARRRGGGGGPGGRGGSRPEGSPGPKVKPADVENYPDAKLYDQAILRTIFIDFEQNDWEEELADFKPTDVEVPATMTVDGKKYPNVGVSFRGASSYFSVPAGSKRSLNLSMDYLDDTQKLYGYKSLNLLNCNGDASMMSSFLYYPIASKKIAAPKVNFVKVVINGRSWGVYANAQQFNKDFLKENYKTKKGNRWKVSGSPRGDGGLRYLGEDIEDYRTRFEIKSKDDDKAWQDLIKLCKTLQETPADQLEEKLGPMLDIDGALWFLAVDVALINSDGYWTRASDYSIFENKDGKFHILPHDMNESFRAGHGGPGGGPGGGPPRGGNPLGFLFGGPEGGPPQGEGGPPQDGQGGPPQRGQRGQGGPPQGERPQGEGGPPQRGQGGPPQGEGGPPQRGQAGGRGDQQQGGGRQAGGRGDRQQGGGRRRGRGGPGGGGAGAGYELDPLTSMDTDRFILRTKLLSNPTLKTRYLQYVRMIARDMIAWEKLQPTVKQARDLIAKEVKADTRKLTTTEAFENATNLESPVAAGSLREFAEKRSKFLLNHAAIKNLPEALVKLKSEEKKE